MYLSPCETPHPQPNPQFPHACVSVATLAKSVGELRTRFTPGFNQTRGTPTVFATVATRELDTTTPPPHHHACVSVATLAKSVGELLT
ncbi:MAG: hypothetical protein WDZ51_01300, partial [Pirellulaceae bacterium]